MIFEHLNRLHRPLDSDCFLPIIICCDCDLLKFLSAYPQKLEAFVEATGKKFVEHEQRICELESNLSALQTKTSVVEKALQKREEEIATLRGECKGISLKMIDVEEQNQGLREENALAFTKVYKKLESSSTPDGT
jgi:septal ring factor EnvC (AmiA/AmiB activator)